MESSRRNGNGAGICVPYLPYFSSSPYYLFLLLLLLNLISYNFIRPTYRVLVALLLFLIIGGLGWRTRAKLYQLVQNTTQIIWKFECHMKRAKWWEDYKNWCNWLLSNTSTKLYSKLESVKVISYNPSWTVLERCQNWWNIYSEGHTTTALITNFFDILSYL